MSTIEQIALRAGVSKVTVSNVLNGKNKELWPSAAQRADMIRGIARELNYRPNAAAKAVRTGQFGTIGLVLSERGGKGPLMPGTWFGIEQELSRHNLHLSTGTMSVEELTSESLLPKIMREWSVDGLLMHQHGQVPVGLRKLLQRHKIPVVWMNTKLKSDCVYPDDVAGAHSATQYLIGLGHRKIAFVNYSRSSHYSTGDRMAGYETALRQANLEPQYILDDEKEVSQWHELSLRWLTQPNRPTAVLTYEADRAVPIYGAALELGLKVPGDLSILAFHDSPIDVIGRRMATMQIPAWKIGVEGIGLLLAKIKKPDELLPAVVLPHTMIEGATCAPPRSS